MKDRIKKFCSDHNIDRTRLMIGGTAMIVGAISIKKFVDSHTVVSVDYLSRDDGKNFIIVIKRNGSKEIFMQLEK